MVNNLFNPQWLKFKLLKQNKKFRYYQRGKPDYFTLLNTKSKYWNLCSNMGTFAKRRQCKASGLARVLSFLTCSPAHYTLSQATVLWTTKLSKCLHLVEWTFNRKGMKILSLIYKKWDDLSTNFLKYITKIELKGRIHSWALWDCGVLLASEHKLLVVNRAFYIIKTIKKLLYWLVLLVLFPTPLSALYHSLLWNWPARYKEPWFITYSSSMIELNPTQLQY